MQKSKQLPPRVRRGRHAVDIERRGMLHCSGVGQTVRGRQSCSALISDERLDPFCIAFPTLTSVTRGNDNCRTCYHRSRATTRHEGGQVQRLSQTCSRTSSCGNPVVQDVCIRLPPILTKISRLIEVMQPGCVVAIRRRRANYIALKSPRLNAGNRCMRKVVTEKFGAS